MRIGIGTATALALILSSSSAGAQRQSTSDVVVTGKRAPEIDTTRAILRAITPRTTVKDQLPRLYVSACIKVGGVNREIATAIANRMAANAAEAGLAIARPNCNANVLVMIATDGRAQAQEVLRRQSYFFGGQSPTVIARFTDAPGPARVFAATDIASPDGDRTNDSGTLPVSGGGALDFGAPTLKLGYASRIGPSVRRVVSSIILVIDRSALVGKTPMQIADYATMRVLAGARYDRDAGDETILALLEDGASPPSELTKIDRSLLVEMYRNRDLQSGYAEINSAARIATRE